MKENGIRPFITMFHWEFPYELFKKGGWLNEDVVEWFGEYAKVVAENFSDLCTDLSQSMSRSVRLDWDT